jgi:hypothetical protein
MDRRTLLIGTLVSVVVMSSQNQAFSAYHPDPWDDLEQYLGNFKYNQLTFETPGENIHSAHRMFGDYCKSNGFVIRAAHLFIYQTHTNHFDVLIKKENIQKKFEFKFDGQEIKMSVEKI